ncbi:hypothetical protein L2E82_22723 [Cichorium intybus]|uniref:Uncharacterized protein n=1 Tax=Cichorium intybus TaxID=13427 RepID=A0ACB9DZI8_CICIN|nr:hypothetical protein L2E82_22723 [Cichorium intybus]
MLQKKLGNILCPKWAKEFFMGSVNSLDITRQLVSKFKGPLKSGKKGPTRKSNVHDEGEVGNEGNENEAGDGVYKSEAANAGTQTEAGNEVNELQAGNEVNESEAANAGTQTEAGNEFNETESRNGDNESVMVNEEDLIGTMTQESTTLGEHMLKGQSG